MYLEIFVSFLESLSLFSRTARTILSTFHRKELSCQDLSQFLTPCLIPCIQDVCHNNS